MHKKSKSTKTCLSAWALECTVYNKIVWLVFDLFDHSGHDTWFGKKLTHFTTFFKDQDKCNSYCHTMTNCKLYGTMPPPFQGSRIVILPKALALSKSQLSSTYIFCRIVVSMAGLPLKNKFTLKHTCHSEPSASCNECWQTDTFLPFDVIQSGKVVITSWVTAKGNIIVQANTSVMCHKKQAWEKIEHWLTCTLVSADHIACKIVRLLVHRWTCQGTIVFNFFIVHACCV